MNVLFFSVSLVKIKLFKIPRRQSPTHFTSPDSTKRDSFVAFSSVLSCRLRVGGGANWAFVHWKLLQAC